MRNQDPEKVLSPLVQLLPAVVLAASVMLTLPRTAPILPAVPERLVPTPPAETQTVPEPAAEEVSALPGLPYPDGVYTGSSRGYGGKVTVQVTMKDGSISDIQITDASHETAAFLKRSKRLLSTVLTEQTWEVDAVSEATYTSRGILGAIQNALTGEVVNNPLPPQPKPQEPLVIDDQALPSVYRDGVYTASAEGFGGPITVQVTISGDAISYISIVSAEGETNPYFTRARHVISAILDEQTPDVDAVSGATYSSVGIRNAVKSALLSASADTDAASTETEPASDSTVEEVPAASPDSEAASVAAPTVEVVQAEKKPASLFEQAKALWDALFPSKAAETPASSDASSVPDGATDAEEPDSCTESSPTPDTAGLLPETPETTSEHPEEAAE